MTLLPVTNPHDPDLRDPDSRARARLVVVILVRTSPVLIHATLFLVTMILIPALKLKSS